MATNIYSHTQVLTEDVAFLVDPEPKKMAEGLICALSSNGLVNEKVENAKRMYEAEVFSNNL